MGARNTEYAGTKDTSYIRVSLKDDNLGLGAKSSVNLPATGLDAFQGLLGRLNGKSDADLEKEKLSRDKLKRAMYTESRWGALQFVSGGFLVGDRALEGATHEGKAATLEGKAMRSNNSGNTQNEGEPQKSSQNSDLENTPIKIKAKKSRKRNRDRAEARVQDAGKLPEQDSHEQTNLGKGEAPSNAGPPDIQTLSVSEEESGRLARKARRKAAKRAKKAEEQSDRVSGAAERYAFPSEKIQEKPKDKETVVVEAASSPAPATVYQDQRRKVRLRDIQQKKVALMDPKMLNEILMIKA